MAGTENLLDQESADEWLYFGNIAREQGVLGIMIDVFDNLENLFKDLNKKILYQNHYFYGTGTPSVRTIGIGPIICFYID